MQERSAHDESKMKLQYRNFVACIPTAEKKLSKPCREATARQRNWERWEILQDSSNLKQEDIERPKLFEGIEKSCEI